VEWSGVERRRVARCAKTDSAVVKMTRNQKGSFLCSTGEHIECATVETNLASNQSSSTNQNLQKPTKYAQAEELDRIIDLNMVLDSEDGHTVLKRAHTLYLRPNVVVKVSNSTLLKFLTTI